MRRVSILHNVAVRSLRCIHTVSALCTYAFPLFALPLSLLPDKRPFRVVCAFSAPNLLFRSPNTFFRSMSSFGRIPDATRTNPKVPLLVGSEFSLRGRVCASLENKLNTAFRRAVGDLYHILYQQALTPPCPCCQLPKVYDYVQYIHDVQL